jgi:hypothetical protein
LSGGRYPATPLRTPPAIERPPPPGRHATLPPGWYTFRPARLVHFSPVKLVQFSTVDDKSVRGSIPPQYHEQFDDVAAMVRTDAARVREQVGVYHERLMQAQAVAPRAPWTRKDQALWIQRHAPKELHAMLFAILDAKPIEPILASRLRASYRTAPAVAVVEDDA